MVQALFFTLTSGPIFSSGDSMSFFGFWFFLLGVILLYRYGFFTRLGGLWLSLITVYLIPWVVVHISNISNMEGYYTRVAAFIIFLLSCLALLYVIFEAEIRSLIGINAKKDIALAEQAELIQRMEPLSVLGERTIHVVHSLKNTMQQVSTAKFLLQHKGDIDGALERLMVYSRSMEERITNVLMVSQAGHKQEIEDFDLERLLDGINFIFLQEEKLQQQSKIDLSLPGHPVIVRAVRWKMVLLVENLLRNSIEAITSSGHKGTIRIVLVDRELVVANDGGAMPGCVECTLGPCLECPRYGRIGQTYNKKNGSGHGLAQVFDTVRQAGWGIRVSAEGNWTRFHITLK